MVRKVHDWDWLKGHLKTLKLGERTKKLKEISPGVYYPTQRWCPLKLISLMLYSNVYTKIMSNCRCLFPNGILYVDLLADSGINKLRNGDFMLGSPLIASLSCEPQFDKLLLIDINQKYAEALEKRLEASETGIPFKIFEGNVNTEINDLVAEIPEKSHYLAFIDNQGLDVNWETMESLLKHPGDLIINFPTRGICRVFGQIKNGITSEETLNVFFGDNGWREAKSENDLVRYYMKKISEFNRKKIQNIEVKSTTGGQFRYDMLFAAKKTRDGSPWFDSVVEDLKKRIEKNPGNIVKVALDVLAGRATELKSFID